MIGAILIILLLVIVLHSVFNSKNFNASHEGSYIMKSNIKHLRKDVKNKNRFFKNLNEDL